MMTTLTTDDFDGDDDYDVVANAYRKKHNKEMTDVAKVLNQARLVYRIKERNN